MTAVDDDRNDDELAALLADYQTQLAGGNSSTVDSDGRLSALSRDAIDRLENARRCLLRLERIWPQAGPLEDGLPRAIGRFAIVREVGRGGFGIVYLAEDSTLGRRIALKVQRPEAIISAPLRRRFAREARAAARLRHPHIAAVFETGESGLRIWIAEEFVDGGSLAGWLKGRPRTVSAQAAAAFLTLLADAIEYSHSQGVLHRDLKPSNVLLARTAPATSDDDRDLTHADLVQFSPKLIDFGLAKLDEADRQETRSGALIGTTQYMAPEQAGGHVREIGPATDVYGLGTILYELLIGKPPFGGQNEIQTLRQIVENEPTSPRKLRHDVPRDLEAIAVKCLQKRPESRYPTAAALADDLRRFLAGQPTVARPLSPQQKFIKWARRKPALAGLFAVSLAAIFIITATTAAYVRGLQSARNDADASAETARQQEDITNTHLYASRMRLGYELLDQGDADQVATLVAPYESGAELANRRGFEWYLLKRRLHGERVSLTGHRGEVYKVAFSPDGGLLVSGGEDGVIRFWDPVIGKPLGAISGHTSCVNDLSFSPDGKTLASASCDHTVKLWQVSTRELVTTLDQRTHEVHSVAYSPDGCWLLTGAHDNFARVFELASNEVVLSFDTLGPVNCALWRDQETVLVAAGERTAGEPAHIFECRVPTGVHRAVLGRTNSMALTPDGDDLIVTAGNGDAGAAQDFSAHQSQLRGHTGRVHCLAAAPLGGRVATCSSDRTVRIWKWPSAECEQILLGHAARVQSVAFSPDGLQLASASFDGTVKLWDTRSDTMPRVNTTAAFNRLHRTISAISSDCRWLAVAQGLNELAVFEIATGRLLGGRTLSALPVALHVSSTEVPTVLCVTSDAHVWKCNWQTDVVELLDPLSIRDILFATFSRDSRHLFITTANGTLIVFDRVSREVWLNMKQDQPLVFSSDERTAAAASNPVVGSEIAFLDLSLKHLTVRELTAPQLLGITSGTRVKLLRQMDVARHAYAVTDAATNRDLFFINRSSPVQAAAFSPDSQTLATGEPNGKVCLWNMATGQLISQLPTSQGTVDLVQFSLDGRALTALVQGPPQGAVPNDQTTCHLYVWEGDDGR